jgi:lactoylglutathione lyase
MTSVLGVWHFAFHVADLDQSIAFYRDVLGMRLIHQQEQANAYTRALVGYPDASLRIAQLAMPSRPEGLLSTHELELVEYVIPRGAALGSERCRPGSAHMAFAVSDIVREYARLTDAGVRFVSPPNRIEAGVNQGGACCYFLDPDDITLELVQPPTSQLITRAEPPTARGDQRPTYRNRIDHDEGAEA